MCDPGLLNVHTTNHVKSIQYTELPLLHYKIEL